MSKKMNGKLWFNILLFSLMGQIAWNVENMYFNTFLYNSVYSGASQVAVEGTMPVVTAISRMVSLSAVTAVVATFIMGTLSDKLKNRKLFISGGYLLWGFVTALFGFISRDNISLIFGLSDEVKILSFTVWTVIIMDCVMTFMGSTSNDSAFNAWVTDVTTTEVRPKVEAILTVLPGVAMGIVMGVGTLAQTGVISYSAFFIGLGAFVMLCGVAGFFLLEEPEHREKDNVNVNYFESLIYGFKPSVIKENSRLYLTLVALCCLNVATQVFFPYLLTYLQYVILPDSSQIDFGSVGVTVPLLIFVAVTVVLFVVLMKLIKKNKKLTLIICSVIFSISLGSLYFCHDIVSLVVFALPLAPAIFLFTVHINASVRDFTPVGKAGMFQGVRMIFAVLIPMVIGPMLGERACLNSNVQYVDEYGVTQVVPASSMFFFAGIVAICTILPLVFLKKKDFNTSENQN